MNSNTNNEFSSLIDEILISVFEFLDFRSICAVALSSKRFYTLSRHECIWRNLCEGELQFPKVIKKANSYLHHTPQPPQLLFLKNFATETTWKLLYKVLHFPATLYCIQNTFLKRKKLLEKMAAVSGKEQNQLKPLLEKDLIPVIQNAPLYVCLESKFNDFSEYPTTITCKRLTEVSVPLPPPVNTNLISTSTNDGIEYCVWLQNDESHSFTQVTNQLRKAIKCSFEHAEILAWKAHSTGETVAFAGEMKECVQVASCLSSIGLGAHIKPSVRRSMDILDKIYETRKYTEEDSKEQIAARSEDSAPQKKLPEEYIVVMYRAQVSFTALMQDLDEICGIEQAEAMRTAFIMFKFGSHFVFKSTKKHEAEEVLNKLSAKLYNVVLKTLEEYAEEIEPFEDEEGEGEEDDDEYEDVEMEEGEAENEQ